MEISDCKEEELELMVEWRSASMTDGAQSAMIILERKRQPLCADNKDFLQKVCGYYTADTVL